jgi:predicted transcriptional regulator
LLAALSAPSAFGVTEGEKAPYFKITSADDEVLTSDMIRGKLAVIFYETKDAKERNRELKDDLNDFFEKRSSEEQEGIARVAVIRCSLFMPNVWRRGLRENSKKEGMTIYGDWDGSMGKSYGMTANESNLVIIDRSGIVKYVRSGRIPKEEFSAIEKILSDPERP